MTSSLVLPKLRTSLDLRPATRYGGVPRRYDETKPVMVQGFTHKKILDIGTVIQRKTLERCIVEKDIAVKDAEAQIWIQAEKLKQEALEKAERKAKAEIECLIARLEKKHSRALREEAIRVEAEMQKLALEEVQKERREGERRLAEAVCKAQVRGEENLVAAVDEARAEEREVAAQQVTRVTQEEHERLDLALKKCAADKASALEKLELALLTQAREQVTRAHAEEQKMTIEKLAQTQNLYEQQIRVLQEQISEAKLEVTRSEQHIMEVQRQREEMKEELMEIKAYFSDFIRRVKPYNQTESDFIVPPQLSPNEVDASCNTRRVF